MNMSKQEILAHIALQSASLQLALLELAEAERQVASGFMGNAGAQLARVDCLTAGIKALAERL